MGPEDRAPWYFLLLSYRSPFLLLGVTLTCDLSCGLGEAEAPLAFVLSRSRTVGPGEQLPTLGILAMILTG